MIDQQVGPRLLNRRAVVIAETDTGRGHAERMRRLNIVAGITNHHRIFRRHPELLTRQNQRRRIRLSSRQSVPADHDRQQLLQIKGGEDRMGETLGFIGDTGQFNACRLPVLQRLAYPVKQATARTAVFGVGVAVRVGSPSSSRILIPDILHDSRTPERDLHRPS